MSQSKVMVPGTCHTPSSRPDISRSPHANWVADVSIFSTGSTACAGGSVALSDAARAKLTNRLFILMVPSTIVATVVVTSDMAARPLFRHLECALCAYSVSMIPWLEWITAACVLLALGQAVLCWRTRARERRWREALEALSKHDYNGAAALVEKLEGPTQSDSLAQLLRRSMEEAQNEAREQ